MNVSALLAEAGLLMVVGMAVVFLFLSLLIGAIKVLTAFAEKYPDPVVAQRGTAKVSIPNQTSPQVIAAISAAIKQYKSNNK